MSKRDTQAALDDEDSAMLLRRILKLRDVVDAEKENLARLIRELAGAKRRVKEAGWNLAAAEQSARQAVGRSERK